MRTPLKTLQENIDKLSFVCDKKYVEDYKKCLSSVFGRIDEFFVANGLYDVVNYQKIVDEILNKNRLSFKIEDLSLFCRSGEFCPMPSGKKEIILSKDYFGKGKTTEGILCHEFLHYITLGPSKIEYKKDGKTFEVTPPYHSSLYLQAGSLKNVTEDTYLPLKSSLDGGFICEALTESLKQQIYPENEATKFYLPQTTLFAFLGKIVGQDVSIKDFLRCDMPTFSSLLGKKNYLKFEEACARFQKKFDLNEKINFYEDKDYKIAHTLATCSILKDIGANPQNYLPKDVLRIISTIKTDTPFRKIDKNYVEKHFGKSIDRAYRKYVQALTLDEKSRADFDNLFQKTLNLETKQNDRIFDLPFENSAFLLKRKEKGYSILCDDIEVPSTLLPSKDEAFELFSKKNRIEVSNAKNVYSFSLKSLKNQSINTIEVLENDAKTRLTIRNNNGEFCKISFKQEEEKRVAEILKNTQTLACFCPWAKENIENNFSNKKASVIKDEEKDMEL